MSKEKYIIASCVISNDNVLKNDEKLFSSKVENIQPFLLSVYQFFKIDYSKFYKMDNLSKLGFLTSEILLKNEDFSIYKPADTGIVFTNSNASLDADIRYFQSTKEVASPGLFVYTLPNIVMGEICIRNNFKGENAFFVFNEFNAQFLLQYVSDLIDRNVIKSCICGWVDVLEENYKAVLFLVGKNKHANALLFDEENMKRIFKSV